MSLKTSFTTAPYPDTVLHVVSTDDKENTPSAQRSTTRKSRLEFLDFLRFLAAFSVLIQHGCEKVFPGFVKFCTNYFQFGVFGVTLFFLCSGFVIPVSLEKAHSLSKFWKGRFFRLYPLYLASMITTIVLIATGVSNRTMPSSADLLANLTMLQKFMGRPSILHLYWTLCLEMAFYIIISVIYAAGLLKKTVALTITSLTVSLLIGVVGTRVFQLFTNGWGTAYYFSVMFIGFLFYRFYKGQVSAPVFRTLLIAAIATLFLVTGSNLYQKDQPEFLGTLSFLPVTLAMLAAFIIFSISFQLRNRQFPTVLLTMGTISYSLYLVQGTIFSIVPPIESPLLSVIIWLVTITSLSFITYYIIERPFIALGKR